MTLEATSRDDLKSVALLMRDTRAPWRDQVVIIGGWAQWLYRLHPFAQSLDYEPLATFDTDVAGPIECRVMGRTHMSD